MYLRTNSSLLVPLMASRHISGRSLDMKLESSGASGSGAGGGAVLPCTTFSTSFCLSENNTLIESVISSRRFSSWIGSSLLASCASMCVATMVANDCCR